VTSQDNIRPLRATSPNLASLIREARGNETQEALADHLGVHVTTLQRWEAGRNAPRGKTGRRLLEALGIRDQLVATNAHRTPGSGPTSQRIRTPIEPDDVARSALEAVRLGYLRDDNALEALRAVAIWKGLTWPSA
jgi:ribosome-binding protein aMBF1 (putative translation factor)